AHGKTQRHEAGVEKTEGRGQHASGLSGTQIGELAAVGGGQRQVLTAGALQFQRDRQQHEPQQQYRQIEARQYPVAGIVAPGQGPAQMSLGGDGVEQGQQQVGSRGDVAQLLPGPPNGLKQGEADGQQPSAEQQIDFPIDAVDQ